MCNDGIRLDREKLLAHDENKEAREGDTVSILPAVAGG